MAKKAVIAVLAVVLVTAGLVVGRVIWPARGEAPAGDHPATATSTVTRATLVDTVTVPGELAFGPRQLIESRLAGTVTALPPVGTVVDRGQVLFRIDDKPVILLFGALPAYRALGADDEGADVKQLKANLKALGYMDVRRWQKKLGLDQTGVVELGRVVYAPGPLRVAEHKLAPGAVATGPVLACTGATRLVVAKLKETDQGLAKPGTTVHVALPNGKTLAGSVTSVGAPQDEQVVAGQPRTLEVVVALTDPAAAGGLDSGPVTVHLVREQRENVLVAPIGALLALAEGGYGLEIIDGTTSRIVAVETGLFADGRVEVRGADVREGLTVGTAK